MKELELSKDDFKQLPEDVLKLISMGRYSLYEVNTSDSRVSYLLRIGVRELYFLGDEGKPLPDNSLSKFEILSRISINDVSSPLAVTNFCLT